MRNIIFLKSFIFDKDRKSVIQIIRDLKKIGRGPNNLNITNYFQSLMYKKDSGKIDDYFNGEVMHQIILNDNKRGKHPVLENKMLFSQLMKENNLPITKYLGKIENGVIFIFDQKTEIKEIEETKKVIQELIEKEEIIFIKQVDSSGGKGLFRFEKGQEINLNSINHTKTYIIEKGIAQHSFLNKINSSSLNSLRVMTYNNGDTIEIPSCFFRVGRKDSFVDNAAAGGVFLDYNLHKNAMGSIAYTHAGSGGYTYKKHPDTNFEFQNKKLPYPEKVIDIVVKAAKLIPDVELIGWDIGYTEEGPVLIEGNSNPSLLVMQTTQKGLRHNGLYRKIYADLLIN